MNKWIISLRFISLVAHLVLVILFISNRVSIIIIFIYLFFESDDKNKRK